MIRSLSIVTALMMSGVLVAAQAGQDRDSKSELNVAIKEAPPFEQVDLNTDGSISMEEASRVRALDDMDFKNADEDGNGLLTKQEYHKAVGKDVGTDSRGG